MLPILYSFRRCPYAIRARMALAYAGIAVEVREVLLKEKPVAMLALSAKGTVPVLLLADGGVLEESMDIMRWSLSKADPACWLRPELAADTQRLIDANDGPFKALLDRYKYSVRYPEFSQQQHRQRAEQHIADLDERLSRQRHLVDDQISLADVALFPFVRQFAFVDKHWFDATAYRHLQAWLDELLTSDLFIRVMRPSPPWVPGEAASNLQSMPPHPET
jgi:glutathione S-transferase